MATYGYKDGVMLYVISNPVFGPNLRLIQQDQMNRNNLNHTQM